MKHFFESVLMALDAVRANKLRSGLTLLSIAIGIFAIIGAGTAVSSLNESVNGQLAALGQNTFIIKRRPTIVVGGAAWRKYMKRKPITYSQSREFRSKMTTAELISVSNSSPAYTIKANNLSTDPDVSLYGADAMYFDCNNVEVDEGRIFMEEDINLNRPMVILGRDVATRLFPVGSALGQEVTVKGKKFTVIGLLKARGSLLGSKLDNLVIIPISIFLSSYQNEFDQSVNVFVKSPSKEILPAAIDEAIGIMRVLRNVSPGEDNNFEIETNESLANSFAGFTEYLVYFGFASGAIALIAAGIGIMNIMLVSVKERTREIGIRKAIGATRMNVMTQFIIESITLCQLGGVAGIILGVLGGFALSAALGFSSAAIPINWVIGSVVICTMLGVLFGSYPAWKAASLDPIDALRYE